MTKFVLNETSYFGKVQEKNYQEKSKKEVSKKY